MKGIVLDKGHRRGGGRGGRRRDDALFFPFFAIGFVLGEQGTDHIMVFLEKSGQIAVLLQ
jgi:hypothetical protein